MIVDNWLTGGRWPFAALGPLPPSHEQPYLLVATNQGLGAVDDMWFEWVTDLGFAGREENISSCHLTTQVWLK